MMAFPFKDNTNTGGESLCESCTYLLNGAKSPNGYVGLCRLSKDFVRDCGICSKYEKGETHGKQ